MDERFDEIDDRTAQLLGDLADLGADDPHREDLRTRLVALYTPTARRIARRYAHRGEPIEDLEQAAMLGLVKAINRYDPTRGNPFSAYARPMMLGEVRRHFRDTTSVVRLPRLLQELRIELRETAREFTGAHGRAPTVAEIAALLEITEEETIEVIASSQAYRPASLDAPVSDEPEAGSLVETLGAEDPDLANVVDLNAVRPLIGRLPTRERTILILRYFGNQTQTEIAAHVGISQMHVSRLLSHSLKRLRAELLADPDPLAS